MKKIYILIIHAIISTIIISFTLRNPEEQVYLSSYTKNFEVFEKEQSQLIKTIKSVNLSIATERNKIKQQISEVRLKMKGVDFWMRYLDPLSYKKINGPLSVEWETEVFEKFEKPYKREGAGFTLASIYLDEENIEKDSLIKLIQYSLTATQSYSADSITEHLNTCDHFYLCNRLFLLNLSAIYTTGFECPDTTKIIPELRSMLTDVKEIYNTFDRSFPNATLSPEYIELYDKTIQFSQSQSTNYSQFDHFTFIKEFINPLFILNQQLIKKNDVVSKSMIDYSLNKNATSIFNKNLYFAQNTKGIFSRITDEKVLNEIDKVGKLLFYDPILSQNNQRSCVSCHKPNEYFTDTTSSTSEQFNHREKLSRNSPSLINSNYNHLLMLDGKHYTLQDQAKAVICNPIEMGSDEKEVIRKVLSCPDYKEVFTQLLKYTPQEKEIRIEHIVSALTFYYGKFSNYYSPFDEAMADQKNLDLSAKNGFNTFMSKAQCATCHFVPQFNGVKPPYIGSEFEVLGVPLDTSATKLSDDKGRYEINPATETLKAFRTGSVRNAEHTAPYMHNGVYKTLNQVIDFYDAGGGAGKGLTVDNQTLSSDSLKLSKPEKENLISFIKSLNEKIIVETAPEKLPVSKNKKLNLRKVGGVY